MIQVRGLSFRYRGGARPAVDGVSFEVEKGEILGFLGPNAAGKTTTQKILIKLLTGYSGEIRILGKDLERWGPEYYSKIGVVFEFPSHYQKLTALENLEFFRSLHGPGTEDPLRLLELVGLRDDARTRVSAYSKGMQVRLNFARALLNKPQLLFLDEPTAGLDPAGSRGIRDLIREQKAAGHTVFLTTHNMFIADELCDRVAFIVDGRIELVGAPSKLKIERGEHVVSVGLERDGRIVEREFPMKGLADNPGFVETLRTEKVLTIHSKEPTLEDVFIRVTGRRLQ
ncbi:MAG: ABC transporter ATP-binding protein [Firmicutes bacterium]|jgi:fluoroquinolone transport system ATP-binding protein|nr:ABC transporter ATP-binding protein [Bacillota bacterium]